MTLIQNLALVLCLVFLPTSFSNAQVSTTGNLTNFTNQATQTTSTWQNAGSIGQPLTCWSGGDPGYCGPAPRVAAWGTGSNIINYSYGLTDLHQLINIKNALPNTGTGLQVNGFNFGFTAKNGNGWDDGRQDYLMAYVKFYDAANSKVLENYTYNQNSKYNWTSFKYSETFTNPYAASSLGNAQIGFIGKDNNYWIGPYGPEIKDTYFNLKYSVDPCATNVLSSPSCAGYMEALAKITVAPVIATVTTPPAPAGDSLPLPGSPATTSPVVQVSQPVSQPINTAAATQDKVSGSPTNLSFALNLVARNANRERALAQQVVSASIAEAQSASDKTQQQAIATATTSALTSVTSLSTSATSSTASGTNSSVFSINSLVMQTNNVAKTSVATQQQTVLGNPERPQATSVFANQQNTGIQVLAPTTENVVNTSNSFSFSAQTYSLFDAEAPQSATSFLLDRTNPLREIIEFQQFQQPLQESSSSVNRNPAPNELATGTALEKMAVQPVGYANYTNFALKDANFYAPKDIYPKQTTVDNVRALRQLSSDRLHQQMVQDQYR